MEFGSMQGGWVYPVLGDLTVRPFVLLALMVPALVFLIHLSGKYLDIHEGKIVAFWTLAALPVQVCVRALAPFSIENAVLSADANSFYSVTLHYGPSEMLGSFHDIAATLPIHARANMPGKILLYYLLEMITYSPVGLGYLIMFLSNLGGVLIYAIVRILYHSPVSALYALVLYLLLPAKLFFFPLLNTVTPIFILLPLLFLLLYLHSRRIVYLAVEGLSLYALVLFEPLPLVTGFIFLALLLREYAQGKLDKSDLARIAAWVIGTFVATHVVMASLFSFDIWKAFVFALKDAGTFNAEMGRPYLLWVVHNLKDFLLNAGLLSSALFLALAVHFVVKLLCVWRNSEARWKGVQRVLAEPESLVTLSFLVVLVITDALGVNRGETIRLWIFLAVFVQIIAAHRCAAWGRQWIFSSLLALTVVQTAVTISVVGFVIP